MAERNELYIKEARKISGEEPRSEIWSVTVCVICAAMISNLTFGFGFGFGFDIDEITVIGHRYAGSIDQTMDNMDHREGLLQESLINYRAILSPMDDETTHEDCIEAAGTEHWNQQSSCQITATAAMHGTAEFTAAIMALAAQYGVAMLLGYSPMAILALLAAELAIYTGLAGTYNNHADATYNQCMAATSQGHDWTVEQQCSAYGPEGSS